MFEYSQKIILSTPSDITIGWSHEIVSPVFFCAIHLPGLQIDRYEIDIDGFRLRRLPWIQWSVLERTDESERIKREFEEGLQTFCLFNQNDLTGECVSSIETQDKLSRKLNVLVSALRLLKPGRVIDPSGSVRYTRIGSINTRCVGRFGRGLLGNDIHDRYCLNEIDNTYLHRIIADLNHPDVLSDSTIGLAIRSFDRSYGYTLILGERLAFLFSALEATFGEYKKQNRPIPKVSLGKVASMVSRSLAAGDVESFFDDKNRGQLLRNTVAHGGIDTHPEFATTAETIIEATVRDGLRSLLRFSAIKSSSTSALEAICPGLSNEPTKLAFQRVLSFAAKGSVEANSIVSLIKLD